MLHFVQHIRLLYTSSEKPTAQTAHLVFPNAKANAEKTKRAVLCHRQEKKLNLNKKQNQYKWQKKEPKVGQDIL